MSARNLSTRAAGALVALLIVSAVATPAVAQPPGPAEPEADGFLIRIKREVKPSQIRADAPSPFELITDAIKEGLLNLGLDALKSVGSQGYLHAKFKDTGSLGSTVLQQGLEALGFEVQPNLKFKLRATPNDSRYSAISGAMNAISAPDAWDVTTGDSNTKVCVIDTGVQFDHPDLAGNMPDANVWDAVNERQGRPNNDDDSHGTHCAGTIAAVGNNGAGVAGVSWKAHLLGCKIMPTRTGQETYLANAVECLQWCRDQGARATSNSWGEFGTPPTALVNEVRLDMNANMLFIAAAGNDNVDLDTVSDIPSSIPLENVVAVGAVDNDGNKADFSNYGKKNVDLFAPGVDILSTIPGGGYGLKSGTSMATPMVTGAVALLWSFKPSATFREIKDAIFQSVDTVPGAANSVTGGQLNVAAALKLLRGPSGGGDGGGAPPPADQPDEPACEDMYDECSSWADQGFCDPQYVIDGMSVADEACRQACGSCTTTQALRAVTTKTVDISGVWQTGQTVADSLLPIYIKYDIDTGEGYATWLKNPPQSLTIRALSSDNFTMTDAQGDTYLVKAVVEDGSATVSKLIVGTGDTAEEWVRDPERDTGRPLKYTVAEDDDTYEAIADKFNISAEELLAANPFLNGAEGGPPVGRSVALPGNGLNTGAASIFDFSNVLDGFSPGDAAPPADESGPPPAESSPPPAEDASPPPARKLLNIL